jgi:hypothetical protein
MKEVHKSISRENLKDYIKPQVILNFFKLKYLLIEKFLGSGL